MESTQIRAENRSRPRLTPEQRTRIRYWSKVEKTSTCWNWLGYVTIHGYGEFGSREGQFQAHRFAWQEARGPVPDGLVLDHLCRNRRCVNPDHLEAVTDRTNTLRGIGRAGINARKTHCIHGHEFTEENTLPSIGKNGQAHRICRTCKKAANRRTDAKRKIERRNRSTS